jgi:DNA-binding beta-propeller fold protein YncE
MRLGLHPAEGLVRASWRRQPPRGLARDGTETGGKAMHMTGTGMVRTRVGLIAIALLLAGAAFGFMTASSPYAYGANNSRTTSGASRSAQVIRIPGCEPLGSNQPLDAIAMAPNGRTAYTACVTGPKGGVVTPINLATNTVGPPIHISISTVHGNSWGIAITPNGRTVYVSAGPCIPVTLATRTVGAPIPVACPIVFTPNGRTGYGFGGAVTPINLVTNTLGTPIKLPKTCGGPLSGAVTPNSKTLWIDCSGLLEPINVATNTLGTSIKLPMRQAYEPGDIAIAPNGRTAFVSLIYSWGDGITPVNLATRTVGAPINFVHGHESWIYTPGPILFTPDGKTAYLDEVAASVIQPINMATKTPDMPTALPLDLDLVGVPNMVITPNGRTALTAGYHVLLGPAHKLLSDFGAVFRVSLSG